jgi:Flp pilus assembly protein TadG
MEAVPIFLVLLGLWLAVTILVLALCQAAARGDRVTRALVTDHASRRRRRGFRAL